MSSPGAVSHEIAAQLRNEILRGQYRVGERLPSERDLTGRFGVSRGAIREALSQLEQQGVIETQPGGVRVRPLEQASLAILGPLLALRDVPDPELVDQFLEIFSVLTALTAKGALGQATSEQMIQLRQLLVDVRRHAASFEAMHPHWQALLDYMASIDNNLVVRLIGNDIKAQVVGQMMKLDIKPRLPSGSGIELVQSLEVALERRDGGLAAAALEKHFDQLRQAMRDALDGLQSGLRRRIG